MKPKNMTKQKINITEGINSFLLILLGLAIWFYAADFPNLDADYPGPALFPRIIAIGFILCGLLLLKDIKGEASNEQEATTESKKGIIPLIAGCSLVFLFPFLLTYFDFIPVLAITSLAFGLLLQVKIWKAMLTALITALFIYLIFIIGLGLSL
jgi:putative tricarboxylic transport membrane protein